MEHLSENVEPSKAVKEISHTAYAITQKLFQKYGDDSDNHPAIEFVRSLIKVLSIDKTTSDEVLALRRNMLKLIGVGEFSDKSNWKETLDSYILNEVICQACNHCRDLDLLKDKHRALKNDR